MKVAGCAWLASQTIALSNFVSLSLKREDFFSFLSADTVVVASLFIHKAAVDWWASVCPQLTGGDL